MIPAMKAAVAHFKGDMEWERVRPPLVELEADTKRRLLDGLVNMGFRMPGLRKEG
jgi:4-hydroxy-tetrahydrodipicolinate synthase